MLFFFYSVQGIRSVRQLYRSYTIRNYRSIRLILVKNIVAFRCQVKVIISRYFSLNSYRFCFTAISIILINYVGLFCDFLVLSFSLPFVQSLANNFYISNNCMFVGNRSKSKYLSYTYPW